jgi:hypothetical protein
MDSAHAGRTNERLPILGSLEIPGEGSRGKAGRNGEIKHEPYNKKTATSGRGVRICSKYTKAYQQL